MEKNPSSVYKVRFSDCDPLGHLNNSSYIDYFLEAREDHLNQTYDFDLMTHYAMGVSWVVGSHEILYRRPAVYNEMVKITSRLLKASEDSLLVEMVMTDEIDQQLKSIMWTTFVPINVKTGRKDSHTGEFMEFARSLENLEVNVDAGIRERLKSVLGSKQTDVAR